MTVSVVFNVLVLSFVGGAFARRLGLFGENKSTAAKERTKLPLNLVAWPKRMINSSPLTFEEVKRIAEADPQTQSLLAQAQKNGRPFKWDFSLHYRPTDSVLFYLAELTAERCDCEGNPSARTGLQLFLNPYDGKVLFVDSNRNIPQALADKGVKEAL